MIELPAHKLPYEIRHAVNVTECPKCGVLMSLKGLKRSMMFEGGKSIVVQVDCSCGEFSKEWVASFREKSL